MEDGDAQERSCDGIGIATQAGRAPLVAGDDWSTLDMCVPLVADAAGSSGIGLLRSGVSVPEHELLCLVQSWQTGRAARAFGSELYVPARDY